MEQLNDTSSSCDIWPHVAFLCLSRAMSGDADWLMYCYQLTSRVERLSATAVALDVGISTDGEAQRALCGLMRRLDTLGIATRVGIGPTTMLAQLVLLATPQRQRLVSVSPTEASALVRRLPVTMLGHLLPCGTITPDVVARLQCYGLYTLGHIATYLR
jgi:hypothetical protein